MQTVHDMVQSAKKEIQEITLDQADAAIHDADVLLDVREPDEFHQGHLAGAINVPRGILEFTLDNEPSLQDRHQKIVLYCKTSGRAALAAQTMKAMGYQYVQSIQGGFDAWHAAGRKVVTPSLPDFE
ncbi:Rhodanese-domain-containing protein [Alcanivorax hongdengensis A-11-3]|uniref:Rhodanese-domain-containing protein n=1 Tax=Alcanivorax hongdengensis A-11-3 TaxID=1177179 RepID=L0W7V1_9GAMM|nr:rhodanese-like domain-containing protein [Alcanivorax hongdengensis]EKF72976.1 Rhodanese-domain-containing protein [Alcanivorax hongdengensis A-11-3]